MFSTASSIRLSHSIINTTKFSMLYRLKGGINVIIPAGNPDKFGGEVMVRVVLEVYSGNTVIFDVDGQKNNFDKRLATMLNAELQERLSLMPYDRGESGILIDKVIKIGESEVDEDGLLISELFGFDLQFRNQGVVDDKFAGTSATACRQSFEEEARANGEDNAISTTIKLVDRNNKFPILWLKVLGRTRILPKDDTLEQTEGLYVLIDNRLKGTKAEFIPLHELTMDKLAEYGIYPDEFSANVDKNSKLIQELQSKVKSGSVEFKKLKESLLETDRRLLLANDEIYMLKGEIRINRGELKSMDSRHKRNMDSLKSRADSSKSSDTVKNLIGIGGLLLAGYKAFS